MGYKGKGTQTRDPQVEMVGYFGVVQHDIKILFSVSARDFFLQTTKFNAYANRDPALLWEQRN